MKVTLEIPDELHRNVKARSALEGRPVRAVAIELFEKWLFGESTSSGTPETSNSPSKNKQPAWLKIASKYPSATKSYDLTEIRETIARRKLAENPKD